MNGLRSVSDTMLASLQSFFAFLPTLLGAVLILIVGWLIAGVVARLIEKGLTAVGFERAVHHSGIGQFVERSGAHWTTSRLIGQLAKWFVFLLFVQAAANVLNMPQLTQIMNQIILFIPNVIVAVAIVVVGSLAAKFLSGLTRSAVSEMGVGSPDVLAKLVNVAVIGFAGVAALNQLGVATVVVNTLFIGLVSAAALALGLSFGLGGRDVAGKITQSWYDAGQDAASRFKGRAESLPHSSSPVARAYSARQPAPVAGD